MKHNDHLQRAKNAQRLIESYDASERSIIVYGIAPLFRWYAPLQTFDNEKSVPFHVVHCPSHLQWIISQSKELDHLRRLAKRNNIWLIVIRRKNDGIPKVMVCLFL